jgi:iron complex transport system permease protein
MSTSRAAALSRPEESAGGLGIPPRLAILSLLFVLAAAASLFFGAVPLPPGRILTALFHTGAADPAVALLLRIRIPRVIEAAAAGAALAISGTLLQAFFQNPLAGPYVVGVSSGAGLAAVAVMTFGITFRLGPVGSVPLAAFGGGLAAVALVYGLARSIRFLQAEGLLLIGIAVGAVCSALTALILVFGPEGPQAALFWMLGSFAMAEAPVAAMLSAVLIAGGVASLLLSRHLNVLLWGEDIASSLGSPVRKVNAWILILSSLLAASSVAACGTIGFVGLMEPHLARGYLHTSDHRFVIPAGALIGAIIVIPVGAITSAIGAPFLVWLVMRRHARIVGR